MFKKILVPVDGSEPSEKALAYALDLASSEGAELCFCHVPMRTMADELGSRIPLSRGLAESRQDDARKTGQAILDAARYRAQERGIKATTGLGSGTPADAIVELAGRDGIDLIVMGSHGYEPPVRTFVSSTAETVFRRASVPVLILGSHAVRNADRFEVATRS